MGKRVKLPGRAESAEMGGIVTGAGEILDDLKGKTQEVINAETDAELVRLDETKQGNLSFDQTPTEGSDNPVTSGGVYAADQMLSQAIEAILLLIPSAASELNKLVDLATMNSSISTATASFKGTYNLVSDLHLTVSATHAQIAAALDDLSLGADNNDYAFVQVPNTDTAPTDIAKTERYKFNGENWAYEYDLNNSGFTTAQWNAINSGITTLLVAKLSALPTNEALTLALAGKQDSLTFDNAPTAGSNNPVKSSGIYTRNNEIVALINALDVAKQNVLTFDTTPTNGSTNPVTSNGVYLAIQLVQTAVVALDGRMGTAETKISTAEGNIVNLQAAYAALTQSDIVVVSGALPSSGQQQNIIYRQPDQDHTPPQFYSDYMWNGTAWVLMATYNNAIDPRPKKASQNLVTSGGVFDNMGALDVSELNATENPHTLKPYATLDAALADIPSDYQKGGMSVKFVSSSDNMYVQYRLMAQTFTTDTTQWQGVDDEPTAGSDNLVKSGSVFKRSFVTDLYAISDTLPSGISVGEYYFNTTHNKVVYIKDSDSGREFIEVSKNMILRYKGLMYYWDGSSLVQLKDDEILTNGITNCTPYNLKMKLFKYFNLLPSIANDNVTNILTYDIEPCKLFTYLHIDLYFDSVPSSLIYLSVHNSKTGNWLDFYGDTPTTSHLGIIYHPANENIIVDKIKIKSAPSNSVLLTQVFVMEEEDDGIKNTFQLLSECKIEQGGVATDGGEAYSLDFVRTGFIEGNHYLNLSESYYIRRIAYYDRNSLAFDSYEDVNTNTYKIGKSWCVCRISIGKTGGGNLIVRDFPVNYGLVVPMVNFDISDTMFDYTDELTGVTFDGAHILEDIYTKFDALVSSYGSFITKYDIAQVLGLSYPAYANGIQTEGTYLVTPAYKTYMYKIQYENNLINSNYTPRKKMFIVSGVHGGEIAAPFNTYLLAANLMKNQGKDRFYTQLLSLFDIYIIPCVNGYGMYHLLRTNANGVNINRNMPTEGWTESGQGTENYTGPSAGSEFESQIIKGYIDRLHPDVVIDHHNYSGGQKQFYTEAHSREYCRPLYDALVQCSYTFIKNMPEYFGTKFQLFHNENQSMPAFISALIGSVSKYGFEKGYASATIEICEDINYLNGEFYDHASAFFSNDVFKVGEYTLRCELVKLINALNKGELLRTTGIGF